MGKMCPVIKNECMKEKCAWYNEIYEECAMLSAGSSLADLSVMAEGKGWKVDLDDD